MATLTLAQTETRSIRSLGSTPEEVWQRWRELSEAPQHTRHAVVGWLPLEGVYSWRAGKVVREFAQRSSEAPYGYAAWQRDATRNELDAVWRAIERGWFQVEARQVTGCLGLSTNPDAGKTVQVYHQATGRRLC